MLTLRVIPPRLLFSRRSEPAERDLAAFYFDALRRHWSAGDRALALGLSAAAAIANVGALARGGAWINGWNAAEEALLEPSLDRRAHLSMASRKGVHRLINPGAFPLAENPLKNKRLFSARCRQAGLAVPEQFSGSAATLARWIDGLNAFLAKPNYASKGQGILGYRRDGSGWLRDGVWVSHVEALAAATEMLARGGVLQRACLAHLDLHDLSPGALPTLRVMTAIDERGRVEVCDRVIRLSAGGPRAVDNFNAGNIVAGLDEGGLVARAFRRVDGRVVEVERHPSSGAILKGRRPPDLDAALALAAGAHEAFRVGFSVIGWDVGLTETGPVLIEGNWSPGSDILALVFGRALGDTRLGALYRHHLAAVSPETWRAARPIEGEPRGEEPALMERVAF